MTSFLGAPVLLGLFDVDMKVAAALRCTVGPIGVGGAQEIQHGINLVLELDTLIQFEHQLEIALFNHDDVIG